MRVLFLVLLALFAVSAASAQDANECDQPGEVPDLVLPELDTVERLGAIDGITAFSAGSTTCNLGSCQADWFITDARHPVFGQNLFRLRQGRFEQIGQSWVAHRFFALSNPACSTECVPTNGQHLGVNCSNSNTALSTAGQQYLGPKSEVNASTGVFPFPFEELGMTGDHIYKRLQVHDVDLDPALNPGARYFVEGQNVSADDTPHGGHLNAISYREVTVIDTGGEYTLQVVGPTLTEQSALRAWAAADSGVRISTVDVPGDGRLLIASRATWAGGERWLYEYAVQNLTSHRSVRAFQLPLPSGAPAVAAGFHDVDYHSGEPYDPADWDVAIDTPAHPGALRWSTQSFDGDPDANALRWGTTYNFRFEIDSPPTLADVELELFRPGLPFSVSALAHIPQRCDGDGQCEPGEGRCACPLDCGDPSPQELDCFDGADNDCDGRVDCSDDACCTALGCPGRDEDGDGYAACQDCRDSDGLLWGVPGEAVSLELREEVDGTLLSWLAPQDPGAWSVDYEVLRSTVPSDFPGHGACLVGASPADPLLVDTQLPDHGQLFSYLVRATNACPEGEGPLGTGVGGAPRSAPSCP